MKHNKCASTFHDWSFQRLHRKKQRQNWDYICDFILCWISKSQHRSCFYVSTQKKMQYLSSSIRQWSYFLDFSLSNRLVKTENPVCGCIINECFLCNLSPPKGGGWLISSSGVQPQTFRWMPLVGLMKLLSLIPQRDMTAAEAARYHIFLPDQWISKKLCKWHSTIPRSSSQSAAPFSLADEKAECVTTSMTNYPQRNALAVLTTPGQITVVLRLLSTLELWLHQLALWYIVMGEVDQSDFKWWPQWQTREEK